VRERKREKERGRERERERETGGRENKGRKMTFFSLPLSSLRSSLHCSPLLTSVSPYDSNQKTKSQNAVGE
jgi:hypothetical protein